MACWISVKLSASTRTGVLTGCRLQRLADTGDHIPFTGEEGVDCLLRRGKAMQAGVLQMAG